MTDKEIDENLKSFEERNLIYKQKVDHYRVSHVSDSSWNEKEEMVDMEMVMERSPNQPWEESVGMVNTIKSEKMSEDL